MPKVRGSVLLETVKNLRYFGRWEDVPEPVQKHLGVRIYQTTWYDVEAYVTVMKLLGETLKERRSEILGLGPDEDVWEFMGRNWSRTYFEDSPFGPNVTSPRRALEYFYTFWNLRHDTGSPSLRFEEPAHAVIELSDCAIVAPEFCGSIRGVLKGILTTSGAKHVVVVEAKCRALGDNVCRWSARWDAM